VKQNLAEHFSASSFDSVIVLEFQVIISCNKLGKCFSFTFSAI